MTSLPHSPNPVRLPKAVQTYTPTTQDQDLRSQINAALIRDGHVQKISSHLSHSLSASPANWPENIKAHALKLLRSGECNTFPALMERMIADIKRDTSEDAEVVAQGGKGKTSNGNRNPNGNTTGDRDGSLAVPRAVVEEALKVTRECLDAVCEIDT